MSIRIALHLHPFSHRPGTICLLPLTSLKMRIFPARIEFFRPNDSEPFFHLSVDVKGPCEEFTVALDLEQNQVRVFGKTQRGYLRYLLQRHVDGVAVIAEKVPQGNLVCHLSQQEHPLMLQEKQRLLLPLSWTEAEVTPVHERLSLGMHKLQDWEGIIRRCDFKEIFPLWMWLGQNTPRQEVSSREGNFYLLEQCRTCIREGRTLEILSTFRSFFLASFEGMLVPRLFDEEYQGIMPIKSTHALSPIALLTEGAKLIRSLFIQEEDASIEVLPSLPPDFHAGRLLGIYVRCGDRLDIEWTKKQLRRVILHPAADRPVHLKLPGSLKRCRVRHSLKDRGSKETLKEGKLLLDGKAKQLLIVDRFEK